ncbi:MAG: hypothetical protein Q4C72_02100 [Eubacteriales bacterium]|nr:hypothetical protein [Eubacteriales bacterium]
MKPMRTIPVLLVLLLALTGCTIPSGDELLAAPKPSTNYQTLQAELEKLLASGVTYTAPTQGENRSTVQLVDLDGDGADEAISFFRGANSASSNAFKVYIYKKQNDQYVCTGSIEGKGTAILSVDYPAITPDGRRGMVIAWKLPGDGVGALTVCDFNSECAPGVLLETEYSAMELTDLTGNGAKDLLLLASDPAGKRVARLYSYRDSKLELSGEAATSPDTVSVERMTSGRVADNLPAVFAEEKTAGGVGLTTDIFVFSDGALHNIALDGEDSASRGTYRPVSIYASDINGDGMTELPRAVLMAGYTDAAAADAIFMIDWYAYSVKDAPVLVDTTYQNVSDGWTLHLADEWHDRITAVKTSDSGLSSVQFSEYTGEGQRLPLFTIFCATGTLRDFYASRTDLVQLGQTSKAVYFARLEQEAGQGSIQIGEDYLTDHQNFSLVTPDWKN